MSRAKRVVIIAGEESGDMHAAALINQLKAKYPNIKISGIGGKHMQAAGAELVSDLAQFGVTGVTEVIRHFNVVRKAFVAIKKHLENQKPDLLLLVDYPGFNLRLAKYAKQTLGLKIIYYISPQIWAWKAKRIHLIKRCVDKIAVILPFEKTIYEKAGVPVRFVGHPLVEKLAFTRQNLVQKSELNLPLDTKIIALLPGSRTHEIERLMPILRDTASLLYKQDLNLHFVIPIAGTLKPSLIKSYFADTSIPVHFIEGKALDCMAASDFVIVASGTASLECALLEKPMCIIYKSSFITYLLAMKLIKVKYLGLCNLLSNKMIVPEFLQYDCNAFELTRYIINFQNNSNQQKKMASQLATLNQSLSLEKADCDIFELIEAEIA
jgi:lipid-A-disaccharide synthase